MADGKRNIRLERTQYLNAALLEGITPFVATIERYQEEAIQKADGTTDTLDVLYLEGVPGCEEPKAFTLNTGSFNFCCDNFGTDPDDWAGKQVEVVVVDVVFQGRPTRGKALRLPSAD